MAQSHNSTAAAAAACNDATLWQKVRAMEPCDLVLHLQREKLNVRGDLVQLRVRLLSHRLAKAYLECEIGTEEDWLTRARKFEIAMRAAYCGGKSLEEKIETLALDDDNESRPEQKKLPETIQLCSQILKELYSIKHLTYTWPFYNPFDVELWGLESYRDIVKQPMDLAAVQRKMDANEYNALSEFVADVRLIFKNCYDYFNSERCACSSCIFNKEFIAMAKQFEAVFEAKYVEVSDKLSMHSLTTSEVLATKAHASEDDFSLVSGEEETTPNASQQELESELKFARQTMIELLAKVQRLEGELAESRKRMESFEAAASEQQRMKSNENENQKAEEDELDYRLKCVQLVRAWTNWKYDGNECITHDQFFKKIDDLRKFANISDRVLVGLMPCVICQLADCSRDFQDWYREQKFDSWASFENEFRTSFYDGIYV